MIKYLPKIYNPNLLSKTIKKPNTYTTLSQTCLNTAFQNIYLLNHNPKVQNRQTKVQILHLETEKNTTET